MPTQPDDPGAAPAAKPWWLSLTVNSQVVRVLVLVLGLFGVSTSEGALVGFFAAITGVAYALTELATAYGRWKADAKIEFRWPWAKPS